MSRRRHGTRRLGRRLAPLAAAVSLACLAAAPNPPAAEPTGTAAEAAAAESQRLADALGRALEDPAERNAVRLFAESYEEGDRRVVEVFGRGVGIWNGRRQFRASAAEIETAIRAALAAGFPAMAPAYGRAPDEGRRREGAPDDGGPVRLLRAVEIRAGDVDRRVEQLAGGPQHPPLVELADLLLSQWRAAGEAGIGAAGLDEGLAAVAAGTLAPETLRLTLHQKPELGTAGSGVLLHLRGRELWRRPFATGTGYGPPRDKELSEPDLRRLAGRLAELAPARLPANLYGPAYLDLTLEVLGHRIAVQARRFAGTTAVTHGEVQRDFDRLLEAVRELASAEP